MNEKKWRCEVTGEAINISECHDCHTQSCQVNTGFSDGPELIETEDDSEKTLEK